VPLLLAASVTPLTPDGGDVDEGAIVRVVDYLREHGADGVFACGTTGEGVLLSEEERRRVAARFCEAATGMQLIVHCGAQTTRATAALAAHAAEIGADAAAVIPPPYYPLDEDALAAHLSAAADACAPLPFYLYAFTGRSGYSLPVAVCERVRERSPNLAGLKVSEPTFEALRPYLGLGLPVYVGSEPLIARGLADGAAGAVSALAAAFTAEVAAVMHAPSEDGAARLREIRDALGAATLIAGLKHVLARRGVRLETSVRTPLRPLSAAERAAAEALA
jgi:dihydrodipicolinate synthase/N-acetylneuraminate lyase